MDCLIQLILIAKDHFDVLCVVNYDTLDQIHHDCPLQLCDVFILPEQVNPFRMPLTVLHSQQPFFLDLNHGFLPFLNPTVIAAAELQVFFFGNHAVRHVAVQIQLQILIPLDFILQPGQLCVVVEDFPLLFREGSDIVQHCIYLTDQIDLIADKLEDDLLQFAFAEAVRAASLFRLIRGADEVVIPFAMGRNRLPRHGVQTVPAVHEAGKDMAGFLFRGYPDVFPQQALYGLEVRLLNDGVMVFFHRDPVILAVMDFLLDLVIRCPALVLCQGSKVNPVGQHTLHRTGVPCCLRTGAETGAVFHSL